MRVFLGIILGIFITIGGVVGNLAHWVMGLCVERLGPRANDPAAYYPIYGTLTLFILLSLCGLPILRRLREEEIALGKLAPAPAP